MLILERFKLSKDPDKCENGFKTPCKNKNVMDLEVLDTRGNQKELRIVFKGETHKLFAHNRTQYFNIRCN